MILDEKSLNLIKLVNDGLKLGGMTSAFIEKRYPLDYIEKRYPNCYFYYSSELKLDFVNKNMFDLYINENYPEFKNKSFKDFIDSLMRLEDEKRWRAFGQLYGFPEICIEEFIDNFYVKERNFVRSEFSDIIIYYKSNSAKKAAEDFIQKIESNFIRESKDGLDRLVNDTYYLPYVSKYGVVRANFYYTLSISFVKSVVVGHALYNREMLSTQVPNIVDLIIDQEINMYYDFGKNYNIIVNKEVFNEFKKSEIKYIDILARMDYIFYDGYFNTRNDLKDHVSSKMNESNIDIKKIESYLPKYKEFWNNLSKNKHLK